MGGNVATFFCSPDGRVIHAVGGPVSADVLLRHAEWARKAAEDIHLRSRRRRHEAFGLRHSQAVVDHRKALAEHGGFLLGGATADGYTLEIHSYLSRQGFSPIENVYRGIFEGILGEDASSPNEPLYAIDREIKSARDTRVPLLVHYYHGDDIRADQKWDEIVGQHVSSRSGKIDLIGWLISHYHVIHVPHTQMRSLEERQGWDPEDLPEPGQPRFVVLNWHHRVISTASGWDAIDAMERELSLGLLPSLQFNRPSRSELREFRRRLTALEPDLAEKVREVLVNGRTSTIPSDEELRTAIIDGVPVLLDEPIKQEEPEEAT